MFLSALIVKLIINLKTTNKTRIRVCRARASRARTACNRPNNQRHTIVCLRWTSANASDHATRTPSAFTRARTTHSTVDVWMAPPAATRCICRQQRPRLSRRQCRRRRNRRQRQQAIRLSLLRARSSCPRFWLAAELVPQARWLITLKVEADLSQRFPNSVSTTKM